MPTSSVIPIVGVGKERRTLIGPWITTKAAPVTGTTLRATSPAGELSAVNAIGTKLRDPMNSGLIQWRMAVEINGRRRGNWEEFRK